MSELEKSRLATLEERVEALERSSDSHGRGWRHWLSHWRAILCGLAVELILFIPLHLYILEPIMH